MKKLFLLMLLSTSVTAAPNVIQFPKDGPVPATKHVDVKQCTMRLAYGKSPAFLTRKGVESMPVIVTDIGEQFNVSTSDSSITSGFMAPSSVKGVEGSQTPEAVFARTRTEYIFSSGHFQEWYYVNNCREVK